MKDLITEKRQKVAEIIQRKRVQKGWTQEELAEKVGFARNTIARIENNRFSPNADQLYLILLVLDAELKIDKEKI